MPPLAVTPFDSRDARQHQQAWANYLGVPVEKHIELRGGQRLSMVLIPPGQFLMGSSNEAHKQVLEGNIWTKLSHIELPQHIVRITRPFYLGKYEVTNRQWQVVMSNDTSTTNDANLPKADVSWLNTMSFLEQLNQSMTEPDMKFVLPSEAQWEYACRAGTTTLWYSGDDKAGVQDYGWFSRRSKRFPVGNLLPNAFGLYDMHGNVWEWCADWLDLDYYRNSPTDDPKGPTIGNGRVRRGGNTTYPPESGRSALRD